MGLGVGLAAVASTTAGTSALGGEKRGLASGLLNALFLIHARATGASESRVPEKSNRQ
jgi:hypothetical protein